MFYDQLGRMRVKVGELKTHLSKYLREIRETGEPIEVCVREEPVAWLTPARGGRDQTERERLAERIRQSGLVWTNAAHPPPKGRFLPEPVVAPDGRVDIDTVAQMRSEKDW
jgi:prevent-host-death family protein